MSHPHEPTDVGPMVGGDLRASDADRAQVVDLLSSAYAEGRLTYDEHAERVDRAQAARTFDDLVPLTRDLVPLDGPPMNVPAPAARPSRVPVVGGSSAPATLVSIMGSSERAGRWRVPSTINVYDVMGGSNLDFTEAEFESDRVVINAYNCMGGLDIVVPEGVNVLDEGSGIMGGNSIKGLVPGDGPTIVLRGLSLMGGADVKGPDSREQRRRRRRGA